MSRYSASPPQTPAIILLRFDRVSRRGLGLPSIDSSSFVHHAVLLRLVQRDAHEPGRRDTPFELPPDTDNDVFGGRVPSGEKVDVEVQVLPVEPADDVLLDRPLQLPEIHHPAGLRIDLDLHRDLEAVSVSVRVGVVALLEDPSIRLLVPVLP